MKDLIGIFILWLLFGLLHWWLLWAFSTIGLFMQAFEVWAKHKASK